MDMKKDVLVNITTKKMLASLFIITHKAKVNKELALMMANPTRATQIDAVALIQDIQTLERDFLGMEIQSELANMMVALGDIHSISVHKSLTLIQD
jgi:hypothetical protein